MKRVHKEAPKDATFDGNSSRDARKNKSIDAHEATNDAPKKNTTTDARKHTSTSYAHENATSDTRKGASFGPQTGTLQRPGRVASAGQMQGKSLIQTVLNSVLARSNSMSCSLCSSSISEEVSKVGEEADDEHEESSVMSRQVAKRKVLKHHASPRLDDCDSSDEKIDTSKGTVFAGKLRYPRTPRPKSPHSGSSMNVKNGCLKSESSLGTVTTMDSTTDAQASSKTKQKHFDRSANAKQEFSEVETNNETSFCSNSGTAKQKLSDEGKNTKEDHLGHKAGQTQENIQSHRFHNGSVSDCLQTNVLKSCSSAHNNGLDGSENIHKSRRESTKTLGDTKTEKTHTSSNSSGMVETAEGYYDEICTEGHISIKTTKACPSATSAGQRDQNATCFIPSCCHLESDELSTMNCNLEGGCPDSCSAVQRVKEGTLLPNHDKKGRRNTKDIKSQGLARPQQTDLQATFERIRKNASNCTIPGIRDFKGVGISPTCIKIRTKVNPYPEASDRKRKGLHSDPHSLRKYISDDHDITSEEISSTTLINERDPILHSTLGKASYSMPSVLLSPNNSRPSKRETTFSQGPLPHLTNREDPLAYSYEEYASIGDSLNKSMYNGTENQPVSKLTRCLTESEEVGLNNRRVRFSNESVDKYGFANSHDNSRPSKRETTCSQGPLPHLTKRDDPLALSSEEYASIGDSLDNKGLYNVTENQPDTKLTRRSTESEEVGLKNRRVRFSDESVDKHGLAKLVLPQTISQDAGEAGPTMNRRRAKKSIIKNKHARNHPPNPAAYSIRVGALNNSHQLFPTLNNNDNPQQNQQFPEGPGPPNRGSVPNDEYKVGSNGKVHQKSLDSMHNSLQGDLYHRRLAGMHGSLSTLNESLAKQNISYLHKMHMDRRGGRVLGRKILLTPGDMASRMVCSDKELVPPDFMPDLEYPPMFREADLGEGPQLPKTEGHDDISQADGQCKGTKDNVTMNDSKIEKLPPLQRTGRYCTIAELVLQLQT
ncbi:serine-rich adhesin for platelets-like [Littorina saxatilis]|uniref:serine-rich adhesin for platelets-like n=1 Tax=Littorina saxatilis TaxID=31220 RepID=UPI0038B48D77